MHRFLFVSLTLFLFAGWSAAQSSDHGEIFGGYSYIAEDLTLTKPYGGGINGWNASATFKVFHDLGFVSDFAAYYPSYNFGCTGMFCSQSGKLHTFLFGPQVSVPMGRFTPFGRFLFGDSHVSNSVSGVSGFSNFTSSNSFTYGLGGGVDVKLTRSFAVRGQADWLHNSFQTADDQRTSAEIHNVLRISTGIVFRF